MAFTVGLPGGTKDCEFEAYVRLLEKAGVNIADTPAFTIPKQGTVGSTLGQTEQTQ
jgi:hypothetical protein